MQIRLPQIAAALLILSCFFACEKKDNPVQATETELKVRHKWDFEKFVYNENFGGTAATDTTLALPGEYAEFRDDNKVYAYSPAIGNDTSSYSIIGTTAIVIDSDTFQIRTLTATQFVIFSRFVYGSDFEEEEIHLRR